MTDNPLPYSPHAEESLLGAAIIDPRILDTVDLEPGDFYISRHGAIWDALQTIKNTGMTPDFVTLGTTLENAGQLDNVGGPAYLAKLISDTPSTMGAEDYAAIVKDNAARRRILRIASDMAKLAYAKDIPIDTGMSDILSDLSSVSFSGTGAVHWKYYLNQAYDFIDERMQHPGGVWGIPTGFKDYDILTGGLQTSELLLITGEAGAGKSIFVMQLCQQVAATNYPGRPGQAGALYSLEMLGKAIGVRALSAASSVPSRTMKSGTMTPEQWQTLQKAVEVQETFPIYLSDKSYWTTAGIRADLARLKRVAGIKWFAVDYSYLLADGAGKLNETERTQLVIANMKAICKSLDLAGIVIHSKNKLGELRGSGQVKYDADVILDITVPDELHSENIRCSFAKGRELDEQNKHFDLVRSQGIPYYQPGVITTTPLNEPNFTWIHK